MDENNDLIEQDPIENSPSSDPERDDARQSVPAAEPASAQEHTAGMPGSMPRVRNTWPKDSTPRPRRSFWIWAATGTPHTGPRTPPTASSMPRRRS